MSTNVLDQLNDCAQVAESMDLLVLLCSPAAADRQAMAHHVSAADLSPLLDLMAKVLHHRLGVVERTIRA